MKHIKTILIEVNKNSNPEDKTYLLRNVVELDNGKKVSIDYAIKESDFIAV